MQVKKTYQPDKVEKKWLKIWAERPFDKAEDPSDASPKLLSAAFKKKFYGLVEFPYPSGTGLHMGHAFTNTLLDVLVRKKRREGFNVLYPMGWDAFGLPTENYAVKTGIHPAVVTKENTDRFRQQMKRLGLAYNWEREVNTTDPAYYHWTQWIFLQFFKHGLAYKKEMPVGWCPSCKIILANEEIVDGKCERCGTEAERRLQKQWLLKITAYADRLADDLDLVDYPDYVKAAQRNWIGRTEGVEIDYPLLSLTDPTGVTPVEIVKVISCYSTRPDTNFGATFVVVAPEHPLVKKLTTRDRLREVKQYIEKAKRKSELEREDLEKEKTGVFTGSYCLNRLTGRKMPVWVADFVVLTAGTGIVVGVPAHDHRDWQFAKKYGLEIVPVIRPKKGKWDFEKGPFVEITDKAEVFNSDFLNGLAPLKAKEKIIEYLVEKGWGRRAVNYHLRDWIFSRQHYWGEPIPMVYCPKCARQDITWWAIQKAQSVKCKAQNYNLKLKVKRKDKRPEDGSDDGVAKETPRMVCGALLRGGGIGDSEDAQGLAGWFPLDESDLPLELPKVERYQPTDTGESPLAAMKEWVETVCPHCGGPAKRETDTMPNWAGSSWYFLAYTFSHKMKPAIIASDSSVILRRREVEAEGSPAHKGKQGDSSSSFGKLRTPQNDGETNVFQKHKDLLDYWLPVDLYLGGAEHTTLHLLYSRFWHKFLFDLGVVPGKEPYAARRQHGVILGEDGFKMSKSRGNVINPEEMVQKYGVDTLRVYLLFMGPYEATMPWNRKGVEGAYRFLKRVWNLAQKYTLSSRVLAERRDERPPAVKGGDSSSSFGKLRTPQNDDATKEEFYLIHKTIKKVSEDIESLSFNTAIAALMEYVNFLYKKDIKEIDKQVIETLVLLLAPFAPFMAEELWFLLRHPEAEFVEGRSLPAGRQGSPANKGGDSSVALRIGGLLQNDTRSAAWSVHQQPWPKYDPSLLKKKKTALVIQVNGKVRDKLEVDSKMAQFASESDKEQVEKQVLALEKIKIYLKGKRVRKTILVPGRLVNLVIT